MQTVLQTGMRILLARRCVEVCAFLLAAVVVMWSAVLAKQATVGPALVALDTRVARDAAPRVMPMVAAAPERLSSVQPQTRAERIAMAAEAAQSTVLSSEPIEPATADASIRYFDGRPVRPVRTIWMVVTAYSPDHRSCGHWADGRTANNRSVWTNAMNLVAADTRLLPFGTMLTVPGYANDEIVPVMDRGGAIKGSRLDVLYPTHAIARQWGVQRIPVTVWEYADEDSE